MKTAIFVILSLAIASATTEQLSIMLQNQARASDAVDSALDVLKGLKQANVDAQAVADAVNKTQEAAMHAEISDLTDLADSNKAAGDAATEHRKYIEERIDVTNQYLVWIIARRVELIRKRAALSEQRCVSNMRFIISLKEHQEGLAVIRLLHDDVVAIVKEHTGIDYEGLAQIKDATNKLQAYAHLFNQKAMDAFVELGQDHAAHAVDQESLQHDTRSDANNRAGLKLEAHVHEEDARDVAHRFIDMINALEQHIIASIADLEENEIQSAVDLSQWLQDSQAELAFLDVEQTTNTTLIDHLIINVVGAKANEEKLWDIYFESAATLNDSLAKREVIRAHYIEERQRREEENIVLDGIIQLFIQQVAILDKKLRAGATDYQDDGSFNESSGAYVNDGVDAIASSVAAANAAATNAANTPA